METPPDIPALAPRLLAQIQMRGGLSDAARSLGVSQPAASKAIRRAEAALGVALLRRDRRPIALTAEGALLAEHARRQEELEARLAWRLAEIRRRGAGLARFASFGASTSTRLLPRLIERLARRMPELRVEILEFADQDALAALRAERADFAALVSVEAEDLETLPLAGDRLIAVMRADDPLAERSSAMAEDLAARPFIMTKSGSEPLVRDWFARAGSTPDVRHTAVQITSILGMVRAGLGVSVIAEMAAPESHPGVRMIPLAPERRREIVLARRAGGFASAAAEQVWRIAVAELGAEAAR